MHVTSDARSLAAETPDGDFVVVASRAGDKKQRGEVQLRGLRGLISYDQYGDAQHQQRIDRKDFQPNPINALLIQSYNGKAAKAGEEKVFLTSLPVDDPLAIYDAYDLRSLIENCLFRELKLHAVGRSLGLASAGLPQKERGCREGPCLPDRAYVQLGECLSHA